jgi:phosphate transport system substrate-binding protein
MGGSAEAMRAFRPRARSAVVLALVALACSLSPIRAVAYGPTVVGAGSTWVQIALDQWRADIARQGLTVNYQGVGSSAGRQFFIIGQVDFAASEIPFQPDELQELQQKGKSFQYLPDVAGGTSLMYNLHDPSGARINTLRLDATTAARIFTGKLSSWHDPAIQALNPGLAIAENSIIPVVRSDGSGTSAQFSLYLADQAPSVWNTFAGSTGCPAPCSQWPPFPGSEQQNGSDGVANFVANDAVGKGAIGYVEAGYAFGRSFPVASLHNAAGFFTQPTYSNISTALRHATLNPDLTQNLTAVYMAPEVNAYPMSSYSYMITQTSGFDPAKGFVLGSWLIYIACAGQAEAAPLGYSPLPVNLVQDVFNQEQRIPGAPRPPPLDAAHCANPTLTGNFGRPAHGPGRTASVLAPASSSAAATATAAGTSANASENAKASSSAAGAEAGVPTLSEAQREAELKLAAGAAGQPLGMPVAPLILAAVIVVAGVFGPMLFRRRRR